MKSVGPLSSPDKKRTFAAAGQRTWLCLLAGFNLSSLVRWISISGLLVLLFTQVLILHAQPASPVNRVLDLGGQRDHVRLPPLGFTNLQQATIEAWMMWRSFSTYARVFDFGERQR